MTVCLAATCIDESGVSRVLVAADRMVTYPNFIEFEHAVPKIGTASSSAVAMVAGNTSVGTRLAHDVTDALAGTTPQLVQIAKQLASHYEAVRQEHAEHLYLVPRGLNLQSFNANHASLNGQIVMMLDQALGNYNLGVELLLAGVDITGAHIYTVHNPGHPDLQHDVLGHAQIGSGAVHTLQSMVGFGHHAKAAFKETVFQVYASKRRSEIAPGVGLDTDMAVISINGVQWLSQEQLKSLSHLYDEFQRSTSDSLRQHLAGLDLDGKEEGADGERS